MARVLATDDENAFERVRERLVADVGGMLRRAGGEFTPFWALCRCLFPVAEAIADLVHHDKGEGTSKTLVRFLSDDLESQRAGYKPIAATLTVLYRHSLIHTDEMRVLVTGGRTVLWQIAFGAEHPHLQVDKNGTDFRVHFNATIFYDDLLAFLSSAKRRSWGGKIRDRYNSWLELDLDDDPKGAENAAITEIASF